MRQDERLEHLRKFLETAEFPHSRHEIPFITISRQAGAGGDALAQQLAARLNMVDSGSTPWTTWDRELVEKLVVEEHIPEKALDALEGRNKPTWLQELLAGLSSQEDRSSILTLEMYTKIAKVVRAIAMAGRAILVGRGGFYVTRDLPGGIHVRLVAPLNQRIERFAKKHDLSIREATNEVSEIERRRQAFLHRFFPTTPLQPEDFTITLNTFAMTSEQQVACVLPLVLLREELMAASESISGH